LTTETRKTDRIFLDSSILYSACQAKDGLHELLEIAEKGRCQLLASQYAIEKVIRNLRYPNELKSFERCLQSVQIVLESDKRLHCPIELSERAKAVFMAAISSKSDYFLTGDTEYFGRYLGQTIMGVKISTMRDYFQKDKQ
jgi:predicted nucleic acid-binding protein